MAFLSVSINPSLSTVRIRVLSDALGCMVLDNTVAKVSEGPRFSVTTPAPYLRSKSLIPHRFTFDEKSEFQLSHPGIWPNKNEKTIGFTSLTTTRRRDPAQIVEYANP